jgi:hypothetical protein
VRIDFERRFSRRIDATSTQGLEGGAGVSLWYAAALEWQRLRDVPGWIDMGVSTPHLDSFADGRQIDRLIADLESSPEQSPWLAPRWGGHLGSAKLVEHRGGRDARCGARSG